MSFEQFIPVIVALLATGIVFFIGLLGLRLINNNKDDVKYDDLLQELLEDESAELEEVTDLKPTLMTKWNRHWANVFRGSGLARYSDSPTKAGQDMMFGTLGLVVLGTVLTGNPLFGAILGAVLVFGSSFVLRMQANKKSEALELQLPGFLFALKSNIQASSTPERAMLSVIDEMPSPLYDDLVVARNKLLAEASFAEALEALAQKTTSKDLKFLCACMSQAALSGANMEEQLDTIQKVLEARRKVTDEIDKAVKSTQPAIWLSSFTIPGLFIASYVIDRAAQDFWFKEFFSWIALGGVLVLYFAGIFLVKKEVNKIKDL